LQRGSGGQTGERGKGYGNSHDDPASRATGPPRV